MSRVDVMMILNLQIQWFLGVQTWQRCIRFLWSSVTDRKLSNPDRVKVVNISTIDIEHQTLQILRLSSLQIQTWHSGTISHVRL